MNSFGNVSSAAPLRSTGSAAGNATSGDNMMVLGGPDARPSSPSQVLGIYQSYSGGGASVVQRALDDSHMRLSVGSFGGPSMSYGSRPYGDPATSSPPYYYGMGPARSHESVGERSPPFYVFLRRYKAAFKDCSFLLPGLKAALLEAPLSDQKGDEAPTTIESRDWTQHKWEPR